MSGVPRAVSAISPVHEGHRPLIATFREMAGPVSRDDGDRGHLRAGSVFRITPTELTGRTR